MQPATGGSPAAPAPIGQTNTEIVLTKAVLRAADLLALTQAQLAAILGVSRPTVSRMGSGTYSLARHRGKEWEMGLLFVRLFRSLDAIMGAETSGRLWLRGENLDLGAIPLTLICTAQGLVRAVQYLDAARGRI